MGVLDEMELSDSELLCELLSFSRCRDRGKLSAELVRRYGDMAELRSAAPRELRSIRGMDRSAATLLRLVGEISRRATSVNEGSLPVNSPGRAARLLTGIMKDAEGEELCCLGLDKLMRPVGRCLISRGGPDSTPSEPWAVYRAARGFGARTVILAHSHPPGSPQPSAEDVERTLALSLALGNAGVVLLDHIVISGDAYVSLAECGVLTPAEPMRSQYLSQGQDRE